MATINDIQNEVIEEFSLFEDRLDRTEYLIEIGKKLPVLNEQFKTEDNIVKGCQAKVWLHANELEGKVIFEADSDSVITKGIIGLLLRVLSNHSPEEILSADLYFIEKIDLQSYLTFRRSNGLYAMLQQMKLYAIGYQQVLKNKAVRNG